MSNAVFVTLVLPALVLLWAGAVFWIGWRKPM
jgi:hypothetical protein